MYFIWSIHIKNIRWLHGTNVEFDRWTIPPPIKKNSVEYPHSAVFFTTSMSYAKQYGKKICKIKLDDDINLLDLRLNNPNLKSFRKQILKKEIGQIQQSTQNEENWLNACNRGTVFHFRPSSFGLYSYLSKNSKMTNCDLTIETFLKKDSIEQVNTIRAWIEEMILVSKELSYDGIILYKYDKRKKKKYLVLILTNKDLISKTTWL